MNPQPDQIIGQVFAFIFIAVAIFSYITYKPKNLNKNYDFFELGYIVEKDEQEYSPSPILTTKKTKPKKQKQATPKTEKKSNKNKLDITDFQKECIDVLVHLGTKKKEAHQKMLNIFTSNNPKTIQEFLQIAFRK